MLRLIVPTIVFGACLLLAPAVARPDDPPAPPVEYFDALAAARGQRDIGNLSRAEPEYGRAIQIHSADLQAWEGLIRLWLQMGDFDGALLAVTGALARVPLARPRLLTLLGEVHARAGRTVAAHAAWIEAGDARAPADVAAREAVRAAAATPGAPDRALLRYLGRASNDAQRRDASVDAGRALESACLLALVIDARGFPAGDGIEVHPGPGLTRAGGMVRALDAPCDTTLSIGLAGAPAGPTAEIPLRVYGPPATLEITPARNGGRAGGKIHFRARLEDSAGHRLWLPELRWSVAAATDPAPVRLHRPTSVVARQNGFEAHRNLVVLPTDPAPAPRTPFTLEVTDAAGRIRARLDTDTGEDKPDPEDSAIPWLSSYDEALEEAARTEQPILVEVMADW